LQGGLFLAGAAGSCLRRCFWLAPPVRREPGKKQVGAAGEFHSGAPQAYLGAAAAAPNPGMPLLRRKREADWPDSEKILPFARV